jgi:transcriptional regulator with XRE-family HTH domain
MSARDDARQYARLLRQVVELSGISEREVERRLELGGGTLSRIFSGRIELKLSHLLAILEVLEMKPERFFQLAAVVLESGSAESLGRQVLSILARLTAEGQPPGPAAALFSEPAPEPAPGPALTDPKLVVEAAHLDDEELDRRIEAALARLGIKDALPGPGAPRPRGRGAPKRGGGRSGSRAR